jgi:hypothetical protein
MGTVAVAILLSLLESCEKRSEKRRPNRRWTGRRWLVERCLACEADGEQGDKVMPSQCYLRSVSSRLKPGVDYLVR